MRQRPLQPPRSSQRQGRRPSPPTPHLPHHSRRRSSGCCRSGAAATACKRRSRTTHWRRLASAPVPSRCVGSCQAGEGSARVRQKGTWAGMQGLHTLSAHYGGPLALRTGTLQGFKYTTLFPPRHICRCASLQWAHHACVQRWVDEKHDKRWCASCRRGQGASSAGRLLRAQLWLLLLPPSARLGSVLHAC